MLFYHYHETKKNIEGNPLVVPHVGQIAVGIVAALMFLLAVPMAGCPVYNVWQQGLEGKAALAKAQQDRQIVIAQAKSQEEAAIHLAAAEVHRAEGVAKANEIIGASLKNNEAYLRWLFIEGLKENKQNSIIYVPTEAQLPILEAGRLKASMPAAQ